MRVEHGPGYEIHHLPLPSGKGYMRVRLLWRYDPPQMEISELACGAEVSDLLGIGQALIDLHRQLRHPEGIQVVSAGVDPMHQTDHCNRCQKKLGVEEGIPTCSVLGPLTLCRACYTRAGNSVR